jgi:hypothetical protein
VNTAVGERVGPAVRDVYARGLLRLDATAPVPPVGTHDDLLVIADRWVKEVDRAGYRVHGHLTDLLPSHPTGTAPPPDPAAQRDAAVAATAELLGELERTRTALAWERSDNERLRRRRKRLKRRLREVTTG